MCRSHPPAHPKIFLEATDVTRRIQQNNQQFDDFQK